MADDGGCVVLVFFNELFCAGEGDLIDDVTVPDKEQKATSSDADLEEPEEKELLSANQIQLSAQAGQNLNQGATIDVWDGMTEEELERTKASALSSRLLAMQSNGALCQMLALDILFGLPLDAFERQTVAIRNMELDQVNAFIKKVLDPAQPRSWSIVRPPLS